MHGATERQHCDKGGGAIAAAWGSVKRCWRCDNGKRQANGMPTFRLALAASEVSNAVLPARANRAT